MNNNRLWILGASDPEMSAIEKLLTECGEKFAYGTVGGNRVHPGNAYKCDGYTLDGEYYTRYAGDLFLVECDGDLYNIDSTPISIDHHRPGDPGFGKPPEEFWAGSSLGQVISTLTGQRDSAATAAVLPQDLVLIAAADHCLAAAYAGKCPGVDVKDVMDFRIRQRAGFQKRPVAEVMGDIESTTAVLKSRAVQNCCCGYYNPPGLPYCIQCNSDVDYHYCLPFIDMTDATYPELPEAACRLGISYLTCVVEPSGRRKTIVGGCATPNEIYSWMDGQKKLGKEVYGDPVRGYAGAYDVAANLATPVLQ